jgi:hypothetical protein
LVLTAEADADLALAAAAPVGLLFGHKNWHHVLFITAPME